VSTLATLCLVLPTFTTSRSGPEFSPAQLAFAAVAALVLYGLFVFVQTVRHRDYFPETLAAVRNARRDRVQTSLNLALGSAMASIGLTIPAIAVASIWLDGPLALGLGATQTVLLAITVVVAALTVLPGRATVQEGGVHLVLFGAFAFLALNP